MQKPRLELTRAKLNFWQFNSQNLRSTRPKSMAKFSPFLTQVHKDLLYNLEIIRKCRCQILQGIVPAGLPQQGITYRHYNNKHPTSPERFTFSFVVNRAYPLPKSSTTTEVPPKKSAI